VIEEALEKLFQELKAVNALPVSDEEKLAAFMVVRCARCGEGITESNPTPIFCIDCVAQYVAYDTAVDPTVKWFCSLLRGKLSE
jgi:formylmethanofuran dehydrogenase subunit E